MLGKEKLKKAVFTALCFSLPVSAFFVGSANIPFLNKAGLVSASLIMPEGSFSVVTSELFDSDAIGDEVYYILQNSQATSAGSKSQAEMPKVGLDSLAYTPDDIKKIISQYEGNKSSIPKDAEVSEFQYSSAQANCVGSNVWVQNKTDQTINVDDIVAQGADLSVEDKSQPSVLIYHTHTTEAFQLLDLGFYTNTFASRSSDKGINIVRVGDEITQQLEKAGFKVIHDTNIYDSTYSGAYYRSEEQVKKYLEQYPSIKITLDVHRDAINSNGTMVKPTATVNGKKAAQVMIITGCEENGVVNFPDWEYNLRFAVALQKSMQDNFPGLSRPIFFCDRVYNMNVNHCSLLVEFGTNANTLDEVVYSGRLFGVALAKMMENYVE